MSEQKAKVLVVDDDPHTVQLLVQLLSQAYEVLVAVHGEMALTVVEEQPPDLILLDVMMPGMDGFMVCARLKANPQTSQIPIIFLTVVDRLADKITAFRMGGVDFVTKPFQAQEVLARVEAHLTIRRLQMRLEAQVAELDAFAHSVAHDLKSPLWLMLGYTEMMLSEFAGVMPSDMEIYLQNVYRAGQTGMRIVEGLLLLATVQRQEVGLTAVNPLIACQQAIAELQQLYPGTQPILLQPDEWPTVLGYEPWLEVIWSNYLSNAVKYGGSPPQIRCGAALVGQDRARFWVEDNGGGIADADRDKLFREFSRLQLGRARGYGLGLSIVQRIVHRLNGEVGVESEVGQGSCFYFILPVVSL